MPKRASEVDKANAISIIGKVLTTSPDLIAEMLSMVGIVQVDVPDTDDDNQAEDEEQSNNEELPDSNKEHAALSNGTDVLTNHTVDYIPVFETPGPSSVSATRHSHPTPPAQVSPPIHRAPPVIDFGLVPRSVADETARYRALLSRVIAIARASLVPSERINAIGSTSCCSAVGQGQEQPLRWLRDLSASFLLAPAGSRQADRGRG